MKFSDKIKLAFTLDKIDLIREAYLLKQSGILTENWEIDLLANSGKLDIELLERAVRFITRFNYFLESDDPIFIVLNCHDELKEYVEWFIKFFAHLESVDTNEVYHTYAPVDITDKHEEVFSSSYVSYPFDLDNLNIILDDVTVNFY